MRIYKPILLQSTKHKLQQSLLPCMLVLKSSLEQKKINTSEAEARNIWDFIRCFRKESEIKIVKVSITV